MVVVFKIVTFILKSFSIFYLQLLPSGNLVILGVFVLDARWRLSRIFA